MSVERRASANELRILFREIHRLSARLKNLDFAPGENPLLLAARAVLQLLRDGGPQTVPALARARNTTRQNVQIIVDRLKALGCVNIMANPKHKRSSLVVLTDKGRAVLATSEGHEGRTLEALAARLSPDEAVQAVEILHRVGIAMDQTQDSSLGANGGDKTTRPPERVPRPKHRLPERADEDTQKEPPEEGIAEEGLPVNLL